MSKIIINADTETGELVAKLDGEAVDNIAELSIYSYLDGDDDKHLSISICLETERNGDLHKRVNYVSYGSKAGLEAIAEEKGVFATKDKSIVKYDSKPDYSKSIAALLSINNKKPY